MGIDARMFVRTQDPVTDDQIRHWAWELGAAFGPERFMISHGDSPWGAHHVLERVDSIWEDSGRGELKPEPGETFIDVRLATRYYGVNYERGDLPTILNVAWWLEMKIPGAAVWYGGDSSGVVMEPLDFDTKAMLWEHFVKVGHLPYIGGFDRMMGSGDLRPVCNLCNVRMSQQGFGRDYALYVCLGCGHKLEKKDGSELREPEKRCHACHRPYAQKEV